MENGRIFWDMMEMVDMLDSKFNASNSVRVQVSLSAKNVAEMVKALDCKSNPAKVMGSSPIVHRTPQLV
jgi:hypothetical protein